MAFKEVFFRTSSSDNDCILTFWLMLVCSNFETVLVLPFKVYDMTLFSKIIIETSNTHATTSKVLAQ